MSFREILGQERPIEILKAHINNSRLGSSYLFSGPQGIGKHRTALTLAKVLNCEAQAQDSCDACVSCAKIENGRHPDVFLIDSATPIYIEGEDSRDDAASSQAIRIGHVRQLQKGISLRPYEGRVKVFIIDNAHNLTAAASNALLKTLEDPPKNSLIILVSPKPSLLLKTIVSRCQVVKFFPLPRARLEKILKQDFFLDGDLAHFLAYFCEGRLGQALALKDKEILREKNRVLDEFVLANKPDALRLALKDRGAIRDSLNMLSVWLRDIYLLKAGSPHSELVNLDRKADLLKLMPRFTFRDLDAGLGLISDSIFYLEHNINVKLLISNLKFSLAR